MKIPKLLLLGTVVVALCMAGSALGAACLANLSDSLGPTGGTYNIGDTIEYVISLSVPASGGGTPNCTLTNVSVYFFPPPGAPGAPCANTGSGVLIASGLTLVPGAAPYEYDSSDNAALAYLVTAADCVDPTPLSASMATTFNIPGVGALQCDEKEVENTVNPVDAPVCDITGPELVCEGDSEVQYSTSAVADTYSWSVTGDAVTVGPTNGTSVLVTPTSAAGYTVELEVCNNNGNGGCCDTCNLPVTVTEAPDCTITGPDSICEDDTEIEFCGPVGADTYYWTIAGDGVIVGGINDQQCVSVTPTGTGSFTLTLAVCNTDPLCCDGCEKTVDVVPNPDCLITGLESVCVDDTGIVYCSDAVADTYEWGIIGNGTIVGPTDGQCVTVDAGAEGSFTLTLIVCNNSDVEPCCSRCELEVTVEECGGTFCSFTQGFWGNAGGKACDGTKTKDLIAACVPVVVGLPGHSITLGDAQCIIDLLPANGKPAVLPPGDFTCATIPASLKTKQGRFNNVLIGQVVALTLNLCVSEGCVEESGILADWVLPEEFCTVPYGHEEACAEYSSIPSALAGKTVAELLAAANAALAGDTTYSLSDIYNAVTAINEGFDECRTIVPCIRPEICDNGCDDDGDGLVDGDDPDCQVSI